MNSITPNPAIAALIAIGLGILFSFAVILLGKLGLWLFTQSKEEPEPIQDKPKVIYGYYNGILAKYFVAEKVIRIWDDEYSVWTTVQDANIDDFKPNQS